MDPQQLVVYGGRRRDSRRLRATPLQQLQRYLDGGLFFLFFLTFAPSYLYVV